jgi:2-desacetyl-2-hydroxyethyl bacteriochlorophyllide A dehydrogenase
MLMKALQTVKPRSFEQIQIPVPQLPTEGKDYILVRTAWALTCGSDIPFFIGNKPFQSYPLVPGAPIHECTGEVVESASKLFRPGDRVLSIPDENQGLAEYFLAPATKTIILNHDVEDLSTACIIQPLSTVMNAVDRLGDIRCKSLAVIGLGSIGLLFCWLARKRGASSIIGIDPFAFRCHMAEELGATRAICSRGIEVVHQARDISEGWNPPDICIEAVGHQMDILNDCFELVRKYGTVVAFGVPDQPVYAFAYEVFFRKNALLMATVTPDWKEYLPKAQDLFLENKIELSRLITHRLPMGEAAKAFGMYERHEDGIVKAALDASRWK